MFVADLMPTTAHLPTAWIMGFDLYPMDTLASKKAFCKEAIEQEMLVFFEHDPAVAAGYIRERAGQAPRRAGAVSDHDRQQTTTSASASSAAAACTTWRS